MSNGSATPPKSSPQSPERVPPHLTLVSWVMGGMLGIVYIVWAQDPWARSLEVKPLTLDALLMGIVLMGQFSVASGASLFGYPQRLAALIGAAVGAFGIFPALSALWEALGPHGGMGKVAVLVPVFIAFWIPMAYLGEKERTAPGASDRLLEVIVEVVLLFVCVVTLCLLVAEVPAAIQIEVAVATAIVVGVVVLGYVLLKRRP